MAEVWMWIYRSCYRSRLFSIVAFKTLTFHKVV